MTQPTDSIVADVVNQLDADLREDFEERAGIMEFDAQLPRAHAECLALIDLLRRYPNALSGVVVLQVEWSGSSEWMLTTDVATARQHISSTGGTEIGTVALADVINQQYGGMAMLATIA